MNELKEILNNKKTAILYQNTSREDIIKHIEETNHITGLTVNDISFSEGYERKNDSLVPKFGCRWADTVHYMALYHEVAHAIDIVEEDSERLLFPYYALGTKTKVNVNGIDYDEPITTQATERECRVNAIQSKLMAHIFDIDEKVMLDITIKESADSLYLMNDFYLIPTPDNITEYKEKEKYRKEWIRDKVREYHEELDINDILNKLKKSQHIRNIEQWKLEDIESLILHEVDTYTLNQICNPLACWMEQKTPITKEEVLECLENGEEELVETPLWTKINIDSEKEILDNREKHIKKIAYFVKNKPEKPISIDVGIPEMGAFVDYIIYDGNHRLAADIIAERPYTKANIMGSEEQIKELGIYSPNIYLQIYNNKLSKIQDQKYDLEIENFFKSISNNKIVDSNKDIIKFEINRDQFKTYANIMDKHIFFKKNKRLLSDNEKIVDNININYDKPENPLMEMKKSDIFVFDNIKKNTKINKQKIKRA